MINRCGDLFRSDHLHEAIKGRQYSLILTLANHPGISQEQLSRLTYINKSSVTRQLASLEENGYVTRCFSEEDRRIQLVYPTKKALDLVPKILEIHRRWRAFLNEDFTEEETALFTKLLDRMARRACSYVDGLADLDEHHEST